MRILDRYTTKKLIMTLLFTLTAFICIFVIVDLIDRLNDFMNYEVPKSIIIKYYIYYIPFIIVLILPVAVLLSSLFSIGNLAHYNEITAMKSSGISLHRILFPLFIFTFILSVFVILFSEKIVPFTNQRMFNIEREYLGKHKQNSNRRTNLYFRDSEYNHWIFINHFDHRLKTANRISIQTIVDNQIKSRIDAEQMVWEDSVWVLKSGYGRDIQGDNITAKFFQQKTYLDISLTPDDFQTIQKKHEEMTYSELKNFIKEVEENGGEPQTWLVDLYMKISFPFSSFIIILFGAPLAANRSRSGKAFGFGISLIVSFFFFGFVRTGQALSHSGVLPPLLGAWFGNLIFLAASLIIIFKIK